jgi:signal transduction histidine kinase
MGLALARRVVEQQHGGRLVHQPGAKGTTFVIELPLAP